jgi:hypothetical protein
VYSQRKRGGISIPEENRNCSVYCNGFSDVVKYFRDLEIVKCALMYVGGSFKGVNVFLGFEIVVGRGICIIAVYRGVVSPQVDLM